MRALIAVLAVALLVTCIPLGIWIGRWITRRAKLQRDLTRHEQFVEQLRKSAADHQQIGSHFAVIVTDEIEAFSPSPPSIFPKGSR
ncbi:hypothetical protein ACFV1N_25355 [Streptosporangium canum]|uniref:hypothetical protein n=1 Tax=Streptosporangium canum TaxID=324952 RepID=UPI0036AD3BB5